MIPKFRAWDKEQQRWCPYRIYSLEKLGDDVVEFMYIPQGVWYKNEELFDNFILMQSTGLIDVNGVEIFEHDILKNGRGEIGQVIYLQQEAGFVVSLKKRDYRLEHRNTGEGYRTAGYHTVTGNVCENPELLEVQE